jgi:hypothetical protein
MRSIAVGLILVGIAGWCAAGDLEVGDFKFDGPLGSQGAKIAKVARNHFKVTLGHAPEHPGWANMLQFQILRNARGNDLRITAEFAGFTQYSFHDYFYSWSYDGKDWRPIRWQNAAKTGDVQTAVLVFPTFEQDTVTLGHQVPMSHEDLVALIENWKKSPAVKVCVLGQSLGKRDLYRLQITDPQSPYPRPSRWVHYFANQHPGEHNSQWRMAAMIDWLLGDAGADARQRFLCHFILLMSPDAPSNGWYRVNAQGIDMNRSYCAGGANPAQGHEPYLCQKDLESLMAGDCPVTTVWSMHTWPGAVDPDISPGPEIIGGAVGPATLLAEILTRHDPDHRLVKPLKIDARPRKFPSKPWTPPPPDKKTDARSGGAWGSGPGSQFGVTHVLCEGSGALDTKKQNTDSGVVIIKSLAEYYKGTKGRGEGTAPATQRRPEG